MKVKIYKHYSGYFGVFQENEIEPIVLKDTELECYKWCVNHGYIVV